jgi:hypothetical protein
VLVRIADTVTWKMHHLLLFTVYLADEICFPQVICCYIIRKEQVNR